jgi:hypothetical protein
VADVIEVPVASLLSAEVRQQRPVQGRGFDFSAPAICIGEQVIWGASSMILGELIGLLREVPGLAS